LKFSSREAKEPADITVASVTTGAACRHGKKLPVGPSFGNVAAHTIPAALSATVIHPERPVVSCRFGGR